MSGLHIRIRMRPAKRQRQDVIQRRRQRIGNHRLADDRLPAQPTRPAIPSEDPRPIHALPTISPTAIITQPPSRTLAAERRAIAVTLPRHDHERRAASRTLAGDEQPNQGANRQPTSRPTASHEPKDLPRRRPHRTAGITQHALADARLEDAAAPQAGLPTRAAASAMPLVSPYRNERISATLTHPRGKRDKDAPSPQVRLPGRIPRRAQLRATPRVDTPRNKPVPTAQAIPRLQHNISMSDK